MLRKPPLLVRELCAQKITRVATSLCASLCTWAVAPPAIGALPNYNVQILDVPGWSQFLPSGISDNGTIVGTGTSFQGAEHALALQGSAVIDLHISGYSSTSGAAVNDSFQVVGAGNPPGVAAGGPTVALFWDSGLATSFPRVAGSTRGTNVNESGMVLMQEERGGSAAGFAGNGLVRWITPTETGTGLSFQSTAAGGINEQGIAVISGWGAFQSPAAFLWEPLVDPNALTELAGLIRANDINDAGQVAGETRETPGPYLKATRWDGPGQLVDLHQPDWFQSEARAINNSGVVAGGFTTTALVGGPDVQHAALWDTDGEIVDLHQDGWEASWVYDLNNGGLAVGVSVLANGTWVGFLATPVPEPSSVVLLASTLGLIALRPGRSP